MQVAYYDENFIFDVYNGEWMKWTIHANFTGRYLFEMKHKANGENVNMAILIYVDGVQVLEPYNVTVVDNEFVSLGEFILAEGDHVVKLKAIQTSSTRPYAFPPKAGEFRRIRLTLTEELSDDSPPVIDVMSSTSDDQSFIEQASFTDDTGVSHVEVQINGQEVSHTIKELTSDGGFTFYFPKQRTYNVTITAYDFANHSKSHYIYYQDEPEPLPPNVVVAPDGTIIQTPSNAPGSFSTSFKFVLLIAIFITTAL